MDTLAQFKRLGLQKRIMLYVTIGLTLMFGAFAYVGLRSVQQATDLVHRERLNTAYMTAGILNRDFLHVARDVQEASPRLLAGPGPLQDSVQSLVDHLARTDPFPFFQITGVWVLTDDGGLMAEAGTPRLTSGDDLRSVVAATVAGVGNEVAVLPAMGGAAGGVPFAMIVTRVSGGNGPPSLVVAVHAVSLNGTAPFTPTSFWKPPSQAPDSSAQAGSPQERYHLEVVSPDGTAVLGIGEDEQPGQVSRHFAVIRNLVTETKAATLLHRPGPGETFEPHVMAVVPLSGSRFYIVLEQPADVALALPIHIRQRVILLATLGFIAALVVAWVTTRHVVKPTEQLTAAAERMAHGDLESPIMVSAQDEVGKLAESLDAMRRTLLAASQQIEVANKELESQVKQRTARLGEVLRKLISAQEEERYGLARELHDETAQTLGALSIALDRARDGFNKPDAEALEHVFEAKAIVTRLLEEIRRLILDLRPQALDDLGLGPAIRWYVETHLEERGVAATVEIDQRVSRLPEHIEVSLFRVIQEAVNNIGKHAHAKHAHVRLAQRDSKVSVVVADDGKGFNVDRAMDPGAHAKNVGLLGMRERIGLLNGTLEIRSQEGKGTEISIEVPASEEAT